MTNPYVPRPTPLGGDITRTAIILFLAPWIIYVVHMKTNAETQKEDRKIRGMRALISIPWCYWFYAWLWGYLWPLYVSPWLRTALFYRWSWDVCEWLITPHVAPYLNGFLIPFSFLDPHWQPLAACILFAVVLPAALVITCKLVKITRLFEEILVFHTVV